MCSDQGDFMFRMLVFLIAFQPIMLVSWLALVCLSSGDLKEGLPMCAISLMCFSYFIKGAVETGNYVRSFLK